MSAHLPLVSIVVPTYNQLRYLPACLDHCFFQTYPNIELIIVDGGSKDETKRYLETLKADKQTAKMTPVSYMDDFGNIIRKEIVTFPKGRKIKIVTHENDIGATRTYNEGFKRASGKYCTYIVGDDLPHPHMIEEMVDILESRPEIDFIYSDLNIVDDNGCILRQMRLPDYDFESCFAEWFHLGVSKLYRTSMHNKVGLMDEEYGSANDYDHYLRFAMADCRFYHLSRVLYSIRYHGEDRKTGQHTPNRYASLLEESKRCAFRARMFLKNHKKY